MSKSTAPMVVSIVDFPRDPITEWSANVLLTRWRSLVRWNDETNRVVGERLVQYQKTAPGKTTSDEMARENTAAATEVTTTVVNTTTATAATEAAVNTTAATEAANAATTIVTTKGACHCEAGLIASLYLRKKKLLSTQKETQKEPPEVAKAFSNLPADNQEAYTIGVAKKCCPTCKILVDVLRGRELTLHIAGAHSRFHPWVPPQWLPDDVVEEVEKHLLKVIAMVVPPTTSLMIQFRKRGVCPLPASRSPREVRQVSRSGSVLHQTANLRNTGQFVRCLERIVCVEFIIALFLIVSVYAES
ncbi:hypothetical protein C8R45DRAFT_484359 [Mycena sanguinolenta]|nr:hypothetical protein C8R45DRAFT_484359 [Mycena sanguinolenta]